MVVFGALGSGKSHVLRDAVARLTAAGAQPALVRSGGPLVDVAFGALDAAHDPRIDLIRDGGTPSSPPIVVVDDAHDLDEASASALVRAVYRGAATVLLGLTVSRDGNPRSTAPTGAAHMAVDLWLRGLAERVDLAELTSSDAQTLLATFGGGDFDSLTAAAVVGLADGSRMLLRELAREASLAAQQGRDPLAAIREAPARGRLFDAMTAHVAQLPADERWAIAFLGRVPHISFAHAARFVAIDTIDALVAARLLHDDGTAERRLTANWALSRAADRACGPGEIDQALAQAATEMLGDGAGWWSTSLAKRIASAWHRGEKTLPLPDTVSNDAVLRVAITAARSANDEGDGNLAAALARVGLAVRDDVALRLELAYANAMRGTAVDADALVQILGPDAGCETLLRWLRMNALLPGGDAGARVQTAIDLLNEAACEDATAPAEMLVLRAEMSSLNADWAAATADAVQVTTLPVSTAAQRLRAAVVAGVSQASLGNATQMRHWFLRAERFAGERGNSRATTSAERLLALHSEVFAHGMCGMDARPTLARLSDEYVSAALENDPSVVALGGFVAASAAAIVGDADRAVVELRAAQRRPVSPIVAGWVGLVQIMVTRVLAYRGRVDEARKLLDGVDPAIVDVTPIARHARMMVESLVLGIEGERAAAVDIARRALEISRFAPTMQARDIYQLICLGDDDPQLLSRLRGIADQSTVPAARALADRADELLSQPAERRPSPFAALQAGAIWGVGEAARDRARPNGSSATSPLGRLTHLTSRVSDNELTRREREIATLVAAGLSNREIATQLFLSIRTVESHIYQARAKVNAGSRGELGRIVAHGDQPAAALRGHASM